MGRREGRDGGVAVGEVGSDESCGRGRRESIGFVSCVFGGDGGGVGGGACEVASSACSLNPGAQSEGVRALREGDSAGTTGVANVMAAGVAGGTREVGDASVKAPD